MTELTTWINNRENIVFIAYIVIIVLLLIVFITSWGKDRYVERENRYLEIQRVLMQQHYETLKEQIAMTRKFRHDIANHIFTLEQLAEKGKEEEAKKYKQYLVEQYEKLKQVGYCSDPLIDAVIFQKVKMCKEEGINFDVELLILQMDWMKEFDRMRFFFDLTEYAIQKIRESGTDQTKGCIHLYAKNQKGYTLIGCDITPATEKRTDRKLALETIRQIAEQYDGFLQLETTKNGQNLTIAVKECRKS